MKTIVVSGGAGYIGSQIIKNFSLKGNYRLVSLDIAGKNQSVKNNIFEHVIDIRNVSSMNKVLETYLPIDCVIHCAGELGIERSYKEKEFFYSQIVYGTEAILSSVIKYNIKNFIFSSSAALYSDSFFPHKETSILVPQKMAPYSFFKYVCEQKIQSILNYMGKNYVIFRYFNVIGCDISDNNLIEKYLKSNNVVPSLIKAAKYNKSFYVNGNDYNTTDGTCVRDYIDVEDLCNLHLIVCKKMCANKWDSSMNGIYNAGSGTCTSVKEMIHKFNDITGQKINIIYLPKRYGDVAYLAANLSKTKNTFNWSPTKDVSIIFAKLWAKI